MKQHRQFISAETKAQEAHSMKITSLQERFPNVSLRMSSDAQGWHIRAEGPMGKATVLLANFASGAQLEAIAGLVARRNLKEPVYVA